MQQVFRMLHSHHATSMHKTLCHVRLPDSWIAPPMKPGMAIYYMNYITWCLKVELFVGPS